LDYFRSDIGHSLCAFPDHLLQEDRAEAVVDVDEQEGERAGQRIHFDVRGGEVQAGGDGDEESTVISSKFMWFVW
jgi:hypothetical protein